MSTHKYLRELEDQLASFDQIDDENTAPRTETERLHVAEKQNALLREEVKWLQPKVDELKAEVARLKARIDRLTA